MPLTESETIGLLDIDDTPHKTYYTDEEAKALILQHTGAHDATQFQAFSRPMQKHYLWELHEQGVGPRTLSRVTGVPYSIVQRATSAENEFRLHPHLSEDSPEDTLWYTYCTPDEFEQYPEY